MVYTISKEVTLVNKRGLHARASARFADCVERYKSVKVKVAKGHLEVVGSSIMGLMLLGVTCGSQMIIYCEGEKPEIVDNALQELVELIDNRFGETE